MRRSLAILAVLLLAGPAALQGQAPADTSATPDSAVADSARARREGRGHEGMRRGEREGARGAHRGDAAERGHRGEGAGRPGRHRRPRAPEGHRPAGGERPRP